MAFKDIVIEIEVDFTSMTQHTSKMLESPESRICQYFGCICHTLIATVPTWVNIILSRIKKASWFGATVWTGGIQKLILNPFPTVRKYKIQVYVPRHSIQTFHWQAHQQLSECLTECVIAISWLKNISLWQPATSSWSLCRRLRRLRDKTVETLFSKTMFSVN